MNDLILAGYVNSFAQQRGLSNLPEPELFEAFTTSSILRKYHQSDTIGMEEEILIGGGGDGGVDAIAILVNGRLVSTENDLEFFFESHGRLEVEFAFVQAKTTPGFSAADIGNFLFGVEQYFNSVRDLGAKVAFKPEVNQKIDLARAIYKQSIKMQEHPKCCVYYVTTGTWTGAVEPSGRLEDGRSRLEQMNLFSEVRATPVDADLLKTTYRELERSVVKEVEFIRTAAFPRIDSVSEAYIGLLPGNQFIELVSTDDGQLNRELFFDNVRDFQGHNPVNREIENTLLDPQRRSSFPLFNNGITIIARSIQRTADTFRIHDFQVVNGCQTTHILFKNKSVVGADTYIPVKLVATEDSQVVNEVIKATNRQTAVLPEALESLGTFHRQLEELYNVLEDGMPSSERVYYERRSKQYAIDNIHSTNIVTLTGQIKSFIAMFLEEPHNHPRYYGELLKSYGERIFASDHKLEPYYASGVALLLVEKWLNSRQDWRELRPYKHQLLMLLRKSIGGDTLPRLNSNAISGYSLRVVEALREPDQGTETLGESVKTLRAALQHFASGPRVGSNNLERNPPHRLRAFTELLKEGSDTHETGGQTGQGGGQVVPNSDQRGRIKFFDDVKGYGFITNADGSDLFVHAREIGEVPYHLRVPGMEVIFSVAQDPRSPGKIMASGTRLIR